MNESCFLESCVLDDYCSRTLFLCGSYESRHTDEWVMSHIVPYEWVLFHVWLRNTNFLSVWQWGVMTWHTDEESWRTYECVMAHIWMGHVTHVNESRLCNVLQHTAAHRNTLQHTAAHCNTLQHTATHCNTLQYTATHWTYYNTLQHTTTHCNTLQHTTTHCNPTSYFCTIMQ